MKKMNNIFVLILLSLLSCSGVFAQRIEERCVIKAWVEDSEIPKIDDRIRSRPTFDSESLLEIPFVDEIDGIVELEIIGFSNDYLKIRRAVNPPAGIDFRGTGWILSRRVGVVVKTSDDKPAMLYAKPNAASRKTGKIPSGTLLEVAIWGYECFGLRVEFEGKTGWLAKKDICGIAATCR